MARTQGVSTKMLLAVIGAVGAQLAAFAVNWISSGKFDRVEAAQLVGVGLTAVFGALVSALGPADKQTHAAPKKTRAHTGTGGPKVQAVGPVFLLGAVVHGALGGVLYAAVIALVAAVIVWAVLELLAHWVYARTAAGLVFVIVFLLLLVG